MPKVLDDKTKWLLSTLKSKSVDSVGDALKDGANINFIDPETGKTALQFAIEAGEQNLELCKLLLKFKVNVDTVDRQFQSIIKCLALQDPLDHSYELFELLIRSRKQIDTFLLQDYGFICTQKLGEGILSGEDFAILAHYTSRLCGINIGEILNKEHNDDRYMVHLCQYSRAERNGEELEGWSALEFLSIRVFSLFETLVKLKKGMLLKEEAKVKELEKALSDEILFEVETIKIIQECDSIYQAKSLDRSQKEALYEVLAGQFLTKVKEGGGRSFSLVSGYRGHTFYISFSYSEENYHLRFENLGSGVDKIDGSPRHETEGGKIHPLEKFASNVKESELKKYIARIFSIKKEDISGSDYRKFDGDEREEKRREYRINKEEKLAEIYDDENQLLQPLASQQDHAMLEQEAGTCAATNHQVGLLIRHGKEFCDWINAEEKRCIVQARRNEGTKDSRKDFFWEIEDKVVFKKDEEALSCPCDIDSFMSFLFQQVHRLVGRAEGGVSFFKEMEEVCKFPSDVERLITLNEHFEKINCSRPLLSFDPDSRCLIQMLQCFYASVCMKLALKEENGLRSLMFFNKASCLYIYAEGVDVEARLDLCMHYFSALTKFFMGDKQGAISHYMRCLDIINHNLPGAQLDFPPRRQSSNLDVLLEYRKSVHISMGFLYYSNKDLVQSEWYFNQTCEKSDIRGGIQFVGKYVSYYPSRALLGLALIKMTESMRIMVDFLELKLKKLSSALDLCNKCIDPKDKLIFRRVKSLQTYLEDELCKIQKQQHQLEKQQVSARLEARKRPAPTETSLLSPSKKPRSKSPAEVAKTSSPSQAGVFARSDVTPADEEGVPMQDGLEP